MSQKDFTDWNGRKRKAALYPPKEKAVRHSPKGSKPVGFKTKVDRFRSELVDLTQWRYWRRKEWYNHSSFRSSWGKHSLGKLKKMKAQYLAEGIYEKVVAEIGPWRLADKVKKFY